MAEGRDDNRQRRVDLSRVPVAANDSYPVFERLKRFSAQGMDAPETLGLFEIRQVSFALSLYLALDEEEA